MIENTKQQNKRQFDNHDSGDEAEMKGISLLGTSSVMASNRRLKYNLMIESNHSLRNNDGSIIEENPFKQSNHFVDSEMEKQFKFNRSKINYLDNNLFVREEGTNTQIGEEHVAMYFSNVNTREQVHVSGLHPEHLNKLHCIHRFHKSGNTQLYYATCGSVLMIIEAGRVVYTIDLQATDKANITHKQLHTINDVKVREGNTESNINFYYFIISTNSGFKVVKWERIHKDTHKVVIECSRDERRVTQTKLIRELLCVVWEDGVQVYKIAFSKGRITPISNLLLCGGCVTALFSMENTIEAEGWIIVQDSGSQISNMIPKQSLNKIEEESPEKIDDEIMLIKPKSTVSNPLVFTELQQKLNFEHNLLTQTSNTVTTSPRIAYLKIDDNSVKINTENIKLKTLSADLCYCVHDRIQSSTIHIVVANRSTPHIEYIEYNYKNHTTRKQTIDLPKEQRLLGLDIGHCGNPSVDSILVVRSLSGEKDVQNGFFFSTLQQANQNYKNIVFSKFMRELDKPPEDPNLQTPITPNIGHSNDLFPSTNIQQQLVLNTILRELKEMRNSVDFKLDKITHELSALDKRVHNIENILSHSNLK